MNARVKAHAPKSRANHKSSSSFGLIALFVGIGIAAIVLIMATNQPVSGEIGSRPTFSATTLSGETVNLSDYRGQIVMLNFWATWCPPCRAEMPNIEAAYEQYQSQGFMVLAVNDAETPEQIAPFASSLGLRFPVVLDMDSRLQRQFALTGYPTSIFIGRSGEVYASHYGMVSPLQLGSYIQKGLAQPVPST